MLSTGIFQGVLQGYSTGEISVVFYALWGVLVVVKERIQVFSCGPEDLTLADD